MLCDWRENPDGTWACAREGCGRVWRLMPGKARPPAAGCLADRPKQPRPPSLDPEAICRPGPGTILHRLIRRLSGQRPRHGCQCCDHVQKMNAWGVRGCLRRLGTITGWLAEEATHRKLWIARRPLACRLLAGALVLAALALALIGRMDARRLPRDL